MSLLGLDVGTTGCKAAIYSEDGKLLSSSYEEYNIQRPNDGWAELDTNEVWEIIQDCIRKCTSKVTNDPVKALAVSSLGEATVSVSNNREILSPSILNMDIRGDSFLSFLQKKCEDEKLYEINGNTLGNHYSLTKLLWTKKNLSELYQKTDKFLHWSGFVSFMLGAEPAVDYSLANRTLLFDLEKQNWSTELLDSFDMDSEKLPAVYPSGTFIGTVHPKVAANLGLDSQTKIFTGAHDQCANSVGCGVIHEGQAMFGMGTFFCATPIFVERRNSRQMMNMGLNTEHHAIPGHYASFIYNQGGSLLKWYRDTFAVADKQVGSSSGDLYSDLIREIPAEPSKVMVLPHFTVTGPPNFISNSSGVIAGLHLETNRGEILKAILESVVLYLYDCLLSLKDVNIHLSSLRAVGGGSKSDAWIQIAADVIGLPFERPKNIEAGALGAALIAGVGAGIYSSFEDACSHVVKIERTFSPDKNRHELYHRRYEKYKQLYPLLKDYLSDL